MKIYSRYLGLVLVSFCLSIFTACGGSGTTSGGGGGGGSTVTITGTLNSGEITPSIVKDTTPAADYKVVAINNSTNETYAATTSADGTFSISLPADTQFQLSLLANGSYVGPTVFGGAGDEVNMVFKPTDDLDLGAVTVAAASGYARVDVTPTAVDTTITAAATDGAPFGAGRDINGKNILPDADMRSDMDMDSDGIPNLFDADEDNDGYRNGIISIPTDTTAESAVVERVFLASNIWVPHGEVDAGLTHAEYAPNHISMRVMVTPKSGMEDLIYSVQCIDVPADIENSATMNTGSNGDPVDYPPEHDPWGDHDYNLYKMVTESAGSWIAVINPNTVMSIGDTFTIRVTYTDSTSEDFFLTTSYVLTDWAWITEYNGTALTDGEGSRSSPATFAGETLPITFSKPKDEDDDFLEGLTYSVIYGPSTYDPSSGHWQVADPNLWEVIQHSDITNNGDGTLSATIPTTGASGTTYYITPVAESADGQRNGEETWFTKE